MKTSIITRIAECAIEYINDESEFEDAISQAIDDCLVYDADIADFILAVLPSALNEILENDLFGSAAFSEIEDEINRLTD